MKNITFLLLFLFIAFSCSTNVDEDLFKKIKDFEFSRSPDTSYFSQLISSQDAKTKLLIAKSIGRMGNESFMPLIKRLMSTPYKGIIRESIFSMGQIGGAKREQKLLDLFEQPGFTNYKSDIISALGRCAGLTAATYMLQNLQSFDDSLKVLAIQNLAYIYKRNKKIKSIPDSIHHYLNNKSAAVRGAAIYFFHRNFYKPAYYDLLNTNVFTNSITYKYKLSALSKILEKSKPDSLMLDSLNTILLNKKFYLESDWKKLIYKIKIISNYPDSLNTTQLAAYLINDNPHIRDEAIKALGKIESDLSKNKLLQYYDKTNWSEKGIIILNLAQRYPDLAYRLIQQNLDKGTLYFKELLLKSLGKIKNRESRTLLKQFLNVPEPRLQATAFEELDKLNRLYYNDVNNFLQSGNEMLTSYAAYWVSEHPKSGKYEDLISAYFKFTEDKNTETMVTIIDAINKLKNRKSLAFLDSTYLNTLNPNIARAAAEGLKNFDISPPKKEILDHALFVPDSLILNEAPVNITIKTSKGDINIDLFPDEAPATVSNFIHLINNGFYKDLLFHRVVSDFVIQGGDPTGTGWGGPGYSIPCEYNDRPYIRGSVGMATAGKDTGGSQFFICLSEQPHLNRRYTNFGIVKNGMNVVDQISKDDVILNIVIN